MITLEPRPSLVACRVDFFPELGENLVESLSGVLRRAYPNASTPKGPSGPEVLFSDRGNWAVWLTPSAVGLETRKFHEFAEFHHRLDAVVRFLDPGLYKRVGLKSVFNVPSSWTVAPRPLPPDKQHLGQVIQWGVRGGRTYLALDVFTEDIQPASLDEHLEEIFRASQCLAPAPAGPEEDRESSPGYVPAPPAGTLKATTVTAYPELVPFDDPVPTEPSEVEVVADARAEILARKYSGQPLSATEKERLDALTARLESLLPPVSMQDLEVLLKMAEDAEDISARARERRLRLALK